MKITELLSEDGGIQSNLNVSVLSSLTPKHHAELEMLADMLKNDCSDFVQAYNETGWNDLLLRGVRGLNGNPIFIQKPIRQNRRPVVMDRDSHKLLTKVFDELGLTANRQNSIFVARDKLVASAWGTPMVVLVADGWKATAFKNTKNRYAFNELAELCDLHFSDNMTLDELIDRVDRMEPYQFNSSGLVKELHAPRFEYMFTGKKWYGVNLAVVSELRELLK